MPISIAHQGLREFYGSTWVMGPHSKNQKDFGQEVTWCVHFLKYFFLSFNFNSENMYIHDTR